MKQASTPKLFPYTKEGHLSRWTSSSKWTSSYAWTAEGQLAANELL